MKNYYEILEVNEKASSEMINKAFKFLAKKYHPDTQENDKKEWAEEKFKEINEAYEVLSNEDSRKKYDAELEAENDDMIHAICSENERLNNLVKRLEAELEKIKLSTSSNFQDNSSNTNFNNIQYENEEKLNNEYKRANNLNYQEQYRSSV